MRTRTKAKIAGKTAAAMVEHPALRRAAMTAGPLVAEALGLTEQPKRRRTPSIAFGIVIGASAVYFGEPEQGSARRAKVIGLISGSPLQPS